MPASIRLPSLTRFLATSSPRPTRHGGTTCRVRHPPSAADFLRPRDPPHRSLPPASLAFAQTRLPQTLPTPRTSPREKKSSASPTKDRPPCRSASSLAVPGSWHSPSRSRRGFSFLLPDYSVLFLTSNLPTRSGGPGRDAGLCGLWLKSSSAA